MKKKLISLVLLFAMIFTFAFPVSAADTEGNPNARLPTTYFPIYSLGVAGANFDAKGQLVPATPLYVEQYTIANFPDYTLPTQIKKGYDGYIIEVQAYCGGTTLHVTDYRNVDYGNVTLPGSYGSLQTFYIGVEDFYPLKTLVFTYEQASNPDRLNHFRIIREQ